MFSGLAYCADCGARLYHCRTASWTHEQECYTCATYRNKKGCSAHYIRAVVLEQLVLQNLQRVVAYAQEDEDEFVRRIMENKMALQRTEQEKAKRKLEKQERRYNELDTIIQRLYEDHVVGKLSEERFAKLSEGYEQEQAALKQSIEDLSAIVHAAQTQAVNVQSFLKIVKKYTQPTELTPALLREFVEKIVVHAPDKSSGHRVQRIDVHDNFIGEIDFRRNLAGIAKRQPHDTKVSCGCHPTKKISLSGTPVTSCQGLFNTVHRIFKKSTQQKPGAKWLPACSCAAYSSAIIRRTSSRSIRLILSSIVSVLVSLKCAHTR